MIGVVGSKRLTKKINDNLMATVKKSITINVNVEKVYNYLRDPSNQPEWMPGMIEVKVITGSDVGDRFKWTYKMAGILLEGETTITELVPNERIVTDSKGGVKSTFDFKLKSVGEVTSVELTIDYTVPVPVLGRLAEKVILKRNEREADLAMGNIKEMLEGQ
ncbi:MAG: SRPBCC family protein [Cyclobacteriaceae bacterium]|nr:SRPBCC family protein [Cyclobacteriaceae bacterium]